MRTEGKPTSYIKSLSVDYTWSAHLLSNHPLTSENVATELGCLVSSFANPGYSVSGAVMGSGKNQTEVVLSLSPSRRSGTPSISRCEQITGAIVSEIGWKRIPERHFELRVIMGRRIGYCPTAPVFTVAEVANLMNAGPRQFELIEANLFSVRYVAERHALKKYEEPAVIIYGPHDGLSEVMRAAHELSQERFVPEIAGIGTQVYLRSAAG